jgi:hypothetical protein
MSERAPWNGRIDRVDQGAEDDPIGRYVVIGGHPAVPLDQPPEAFPTFIDFYALNQFGSLLTTVSLKSG